MLIEKCDKPPCAAPIFSCIHCHRTLKFAQDQESVRPMRRNSFSGPEFSGSNQYDRDQSCGRGGWRQSSSFDHTSGHLAAVLSRVRASDFPKLHIATEHPRAGATASWMQLTDFKVGAVSPEVADCYDFTERDARGEYETH